MTKIKKTFSESLDYFLNKVIPKKLVVWVVATILIYNDKLDGNMWGYITMIYLGVNIIQKFNPVKNPYQENHGE
jgi:hypothetical protein